MFALFGALIVAREPGLFLQPRFWAEEGTVYFAHAHRHPDLLSLFVLHQGYLSLVANMAALAAAALPLEHAPAATTLVAFAVQLLPVALVLLGPSAHWSHLEQRFCVAAVIVLGWANTEIWLNTINAQFHLALAAFLCLLLDEAQMGSAVRRAVLALALLAPLSSPSSLFLLPLFAVTALWQATPFSRLRAVCFLAGCILQLGAVALTAQSGLGAGERLATAGHESGLFWRFVLIGAGLRNFFTDAEAWAMVATLTRPMLLSCAALLALGFRLGMRAGLIVVGGVVLMAVLPFRFGLRMAPAPRYFYVASTIGMVIVALCTFRFLRRRVWAEYPTSALALGLLIMWAQLHGPQYRSSLAGYYDASWPRWTDEVKRYRRDPSTRLRVWPGGQYRWEVFLQP